MNLLLFNQTELAFGNQLVVTGERAAHLSKILKVKPSSILKVGEINGKVGNARVVAVDQSGVTLAIENLDQQPQASTSSLILALPRPQMLKRVLELLPQFGVGELSLVAARRVEKSYFSSPLLSQENYTPYLLKGMEQAVVTALPTVELFSSFWDFIKSDVVAVREKELKIICEVGGGETILSYKDEVSNKNKIKLAIGPEGGWTTDEVNLFQERGFSLINLGKRVLRVDMAVCAVLSQIELLRTNN